MGADFERRRLEEDREDNSSLIIGFRLLKSETIELYNPNEK